MPAGRPACPALAPQPPSLARTQGGFPEGPAGAPLARAAALLGKRPGTPPASPATPGRQSGHHGSEGRLPSAALPRPGTGSRPLPVAAAFPRVPRSVPFASGRCCRTGRLVASLSAGARGGRGRSRLSSAPLGVGTRRFGRPFPCFLSIGKCFRFASFGAAAERAPGRGVGAGTKPNKRGRAGAGGKHCGGVRRPSAERPSPRSLSLPPGRVCCVYVCVGGRLNLCTPRERILREAGGGSPNCPLEIRVFIAPDKGTPHPAEGSHNRPQLKLL